MDERSKTETWLTAAECAHRTGLSVRALRLYEHHGLIAPRRTGKDWRLYGAEDITRLNEVLALKALGLSLSRIAELLGGRAVDLKRTLVLQREVVSDSRDRAERGLALIRQLEARLASGAEISIDDLMDLTKEMKMADTEEAVAWRRYEQNRPRKEVAIDTSVYADYAGSYQLEDGPYYIVSARDGRLYVRVVGQEDVEVFPESDTEFFMKALPVQVSFLRDGDGRVNSLVHHQHGTDTKGVRVDPAVATQAEDELQRRVREKVRLHDSEKIMRRLITEQINGRPDYDAMMPALAVLVRQQFEIVQTALEKAGALQTLTFKGVNGAGFDVYDVAFENANMEWGFSLATDGKVSGLYFRQSV